MKKKKQLKHTFQLPYIDTKILIASISALIILLITLILNPVTKEWFIAPFCSLRTASIASPAQTNIERVTFVKTSTNVQKISATNTTRGCQFLQTGDQAITYNLIVDGYLIGAAQLNIFAFRTEKNIDTSKILQEQVMFNTSNTNTNNVALDMATTGDYILFKQFAPSNNDGKSCSDPAYVQSILSSTVCLSALGWQEQDYPNNMFPFLYIYKKGNTASSADGFIITLSNKDLQTVTASRSCWKSEDIKIENNKMTIPFVFCATENPSTTKKIVIDLISKQIVEGSLN